MEIHKSFTCKFCKEKINTFKNLERHLRREHNGISERERNIVIRQFLSIFPQKEKKSKVTVKPKSKNKISKEKNYFDKTEVSISPIYTPMGNKR